MTPSLDLIAETLAIIQREGGGLLRFELVTPDAAKQLATATFYGNEEATVRLRAIVPLAQDIVDRQHDDPVPCICCSRPVTSAETASFLLAMAECDAPTVALSSALCPTCGALDAGTIKRLSNEGLKACWPDLRPITILPGGHA